MPWHPHLKKKPRHLALLERRSPPNLGIHVGLGRLMEGASRGPLSRAASLWLTCPQVSAPPVPSRSHPCLPIAVDHWRCQPPLQRQARASHSLSRISAL